MVTLRVSLFAGLLLLTDARLAEPDRRSQSPAVLAVSDNLNPQNSLVEQKQEVSSGEESADEALAEELEKEAEMNVEIETSAAKKESLKPQQALKKLNEGENGTIHSVDQDVKTAMVVKDTEDAEKAKTSLGDKAEHEGKNIQRVSKSNLIVNEAKKVEAVKEKMVDVQEEDRVEVTNVTVDKANVENSNEVADEKEEVEELEEQDAEIDQLAAAASKTRVVAKGGEQKFGEDRPVGRTEKTKDVRNGCFLPSTATATLLALLSAWWL